MAAKEEEEDGRQSVSKKISQRFKKAQETEETGGSHANTCKNHDDCDCCQTSENSFKLTVTNAEKVVVGNEYTVTGDFVVSNPHGPPLMLDPAASSVLVKALIDAIQSEDRQTNLEAMFALLGQQRQVEPRVTYKNEVNKKQEEMEENQEEDQEIQPASVASEYVLPSGNNKTVTFEFKRIVRMKTPKGRRVQIHGELLTLAATFIGLPLIVLVVWLIFYPKS